MHLIFGYGKEGNFYPCLVRNETMTRFNETFDSNLESVSDIDFISKIILLLDILFKQLLKKILVL